MYGFSLELTGGGYEESQEAFNRALEIAHRENDKALEMRTLASASLVSGFQMNDESSLDSALKAIALATELDDPKNEVRARLWAFYSLLRMGDSSGAQAHAEAKLAPAERLRDRYWLGRTFDINGQIAQLRGDFKKANEFSDRAFTALPYEYVPLLGRALLEYEVGNFDVGDVYLDRLMEFVAPYRSGSASRPLFRSGGHTDSSTHRRRRPPI